MLLNLTELKKPIDKNQYKKSEIDFIKYFKVNRIESIINQFTILLEKSSKEEEIQKFLEKYPILINQYSKVYPKFKLGENYITDFVIKNILDQGIHYTLVEIEKSNMRVLNKDRTFTSDFNKAYKQVLDWKVWLQKNQVYIQGKLEGFESPSFIIIGGRSEGISEKGKENIRAWNRSQNNIKFYTYDDILKRVEEYLNNIKQYS